MGYTKLFERGCIGGLETKNRIVMPAMGCSLAASTGDASPEIIRYYQERARGGAGLIITEITRVNDETGVGTPCQLSVTDLKFICGLTRLAEAVHAFESKIFVQLHHPGNQTPSRLIGGRQPVSASDVTCAVIGEKPRAMTTEEVEKLVRQFVSGAVVCQRAGIDGVEIHAAHGYLIGQFLSPHTNHRTDKYGGSLEGRMRVLVEIIMGIKAYCGKSYPISVRLDGDEFIPDGLKLEEAVVIAKTCEKLGVSCINVSCGTYESGYTIIEPASLPEAWKKHLAKTIKENVSIPVIAVNNIKHPSVAEALLEEGVCDFIGIARGHLADPEWGNKARAGKDDRIRKCIGCMECFRILNLCRPLECTLNPVLGRELHFGDECLNKNGGGRKVAVIGGGPAGMQAAIVLKKRGFEPVLFEKEGRLGGAMNLADVPPHKELLGEFIETMKLELEDLGVEVRLNTPGSAAVCREIGADSVFLATGGNPALPPLPGIEKAVTSTDILTGAVKAEGKKIAVIGGGVTGLETAEYLSGKNSVTVVEMLGEVGTLLYASAQKLLLKRLADNGALIRTNTALAGIGDGCASFKDRDGNVTEEPFDLVVLAMGVRSDRSLRESLEAEGLRVILTGDCEKPGQIREALHSSYDRAFFF